MVGDLWAAMAWTVSAGFDRDDQGPGEVRGRELLPMIVRHRAPVAWVPPVLAAEDRREGRGRVPLWMQGVR